MQDSYHHGALRQALLDAALTMLDEGESLTLRGVARRAQVSHAAPYHHFADRRALLAAVAEEGLISLRGRLQAALERHRGDPAEQLMASGVAYVRFALENRSLFRLMFGPELANRDGLPELEAAFGAASALLMAIGRNLLPPGADEDAVRLRGLRGWSTVHGLADLLLDEQVPNVTTIEEAERLTRKVILAGR